ncbi:MAG: hypothetical protein IJ487_03995 [Ruminococcus sp.]|nr:hypothetical protein [Ruminococcus sp.]
MKLLYNPDLREKENHEHYPICLGHMMDINKFCHEFFIYNSVLCALMLILTLWGQEIPVLSLIPSLFGEPYEIRVMFAQSVLIAGMAVLSGFACGKNKILGVILTALYALIFIGGCIKSDTIGGVAGFAIGLAGTARSWKYIPVFFEYKQLSATEGFPHFIGRLAEYDENREYKSTYNRDCYKSANTLMNHVMQYDSDDNDSGSPSAMPEMPSIGAAPLMPETSASAENEAWMSFFAPDMKKESHISESHIKTI